MVGIEPLTNGLDTYVACRFVELVCSLYHIEILSSECHLCEIICTIISTYMPSDLCDIDKNLQLGAVSNLLRFIRYLKGRPKVNNLGRRSILKQ